MDRLLSYAPAYRGLRNTDGDEPLNRIAKHLAEWDITTAFPLVMSAERAFKGDSDSLSSFYAILQSFTIRRAYCELTTKGYNNFFLTAIKHLREIGWSCSGFSNFLISQTADSTRFPSDAEFKTAVATKRIYRQGWERRTRVILEALELAMRTTKDDVITINSGFTVEHVMPDKWAKHWPLPSGKTAPTQDFYTALTEFRMTDEDSKGIKDRESIIDTIGNLTLVTQPLNSAISHGPFSDKRLELKRSALLLNREIAEKEIWSEDEIAARGLRLAEAAAALWVRPAAHVS